MKAKFMVATAAALLVGSVHAKTLVFCSEGSPEGFTPALYTAGTTFDASSRQVFNKLVEFETGTTKIVPQRRNAPTFTTGTNTVANAVNALKRTPSGNRIIASMGSNTTQDLQSMIDLASEQGQKFVETGNINDLVPPGFRINQDTNPEDTA